MKATEIGEERPVGDPLGYPKMNYIVGIDNWRKVYASGNNHKNIWIVIETSDNNTIYLEKYDQWLTFKDYCKTNGLKIHSIGLQYKSNLVSTDTKNADAVYVIRSVKGHMGGASRDCYTLGIIKLIDLTLYAM